MDENRRLQAFQKLAALRHLDWRAMRRHIDDMIASRSTITLGEVVQAFPPQVGIIELLGYLQIAKDGNHLISQQDTEEIKLPSAGGGDKDLFVIVPLVYFMKTGESVHACNAPYARPGVQGFWISARPTVHWLITWKPSRQLRTCCLKS